MVILHRPNVPARWRARWHGAAGPSSRSQAEVRRRAELEAAIRWIEARDSNRHVARLRRIRRAMIRWFNRIDAPAILPWSFSRSAEGAGHELHRAAAGLRDAADERPLARWRRLAKAAVWPVLATCVAVPVLLRCGPRVRDRYGYPIAEQWRDLCEAIWMHGIMPTEYYQRRVFRGQALADKSFYVREQELRTLLQAADRGSDVARLDHLCRFASECRSAGLPAVRPVVAFTGGSSVMMTNAGPDGDFPEKDLFLRPEKWVAGEAGQLWRWNDERRVYSHEERALSKSGLRQFGCALSQRGPWVLVEAVHDHPEMARFTAGGLTTVRVATGMAQGGPVPMFASMRLRSVTSGGRLCGVLTAGIELETGILTPAWGEAMADAEFESHPDSGSVIAGATVPQWRGIVALAMAAHLHFRDVPFVSWGIAVGGSGPVLLEASSHLGAVEHVLLAETPFAELCLHRLDELRREDLGIHPLTVPVKGGPARSEVLGTPQAQARQGPV